MKAIVPVALIVGGVAFALQTARSCFVSEKLAWHRGMTLFEIGTDYGRLNIYAEHMIWPEKAAHFWRLPHEPHRPWLAPACRYFDSRSWSLEIPLWLLSLLMVATSVVWKWRHTREHPSECCRDCGYDLRATPQRCPECGMIVQAAGKARDTPPIQRTGAAGILSVLRMLPERGSGR